MSDQTVVSGSEAAYAFRELADMFDELIPLFDCGCPVCLRQGAENMKELGEELAWLVDHLDQRDVRPHRGPLPKATEATEDVSISAASIRRLSGSLRMNAAALERDARRRGERIF